MVVAKFGVYQDDKERVWVMYPTENKHGSISVCEVEPARPLHEKLRVAQIIAEALAADGRLAKGLPVV